MFIIIPRHSSGIRYHHHHHHRKSMITTITLPDWSTQSPRSGPRCCWRPALLCHKDTDQGNQHHDLNQSEHSLEQWEVDHSVTDDHRRQERSSCGNSGLFSSLEVGISWTRVLECAELLSFVVLVELIMVGQQERSANRSHEAKRYKLHFPCQFLCYIRYICRKEICKY